MIPFLFLLLPAFVIVNTTANLPVPLSVHVTGADQPSSTATTTTPAFDTATISALVGIGSAVAYRWRKSSKHEETFADRTTTAAETTMGQAESLRQTDYGVQDLLTSLSGAIALIPGVPPQAKELIDSQLKAWKQDNESYYVRTPAKPTDLSADPIVKKLGEVQKISEKND